MPRPKRKPGEPPRTGTELQRDLLVAGKEAEWLVTMKRRSQMCRTESSSGDPDLLMMKRGKTLFIECKSRYEKLSPDQILWMEAITGERYNRQESVFKMYSSPIGNLQVRWLVARPADLDWVLSVIKEEPGAWLSTRL